MDTTVSAIVLAAGKGTRMKAPPTKNKVTYTLDDKPMIWYTHRMLIKAGLKSVIVVVGFASESVKAALGDSVTYVLQENPQGTGHAVKVALPSVPPATATVISMYGDDSAFYPASLIEQLVDEHRTSQADVTLVTLKKSDPTGLGRIIRDENGLIAAIVEEKNATDKQREIREINTGLYCFNRRFIESAIAALKRDPVSNEYYLTDVVAYAKSHGYHIHGLIWPDDSIWFGVNTPEQLKEAEQRMKSRSRVQ